MTEEEYEDSIEENEAAPGSEEAVPLIPLLAALGGAIAGAVIWAGITLATNYEVGYVAWAIGGLVGFAALKTGGRGKPLALICSSLALLSILGGKIGAVHFSIENHIDEVISSEATPAFFAELEGDARDYAELAAEPGEEQLIEFIASHGYSAESSAEGVSEDEVTYFELSSAPMLMRIHGEGVTYEQWCTEYEERFRADVAAGGSLIDFVIEDLSLFDLLFAFLGLSTAYGMVSKAR